MKRITLLATTAGALLLGTQANASLINISGMVTGKYQSMTIRYNGNNINALVGAQNASVDSGPAFNAYCVDLAHDNNLPTTYTVTADTTANLTQGARVAKLYNKYSSLVNSAAMGAALQLAIWDVIVDGGDGLGHGSFRASSVNSSTSSNFSTMISDALTGQHSTATYYRATHVGDRYQDVIGPDLGGGNPVPEPATMAVLGLGAAGILRRRRKA